MKANTFRRGFLFLLVFVLAACRASSNTPAPIATSLSLNTATATVTAQPTSTATAATSTNEPEPVPGEIAYAHIEAISEGIGPRVAGTAEEAETARYIILEFERLGYVSELRPFSVIVKGRTINSANVIAVKPGAYSQEIIVGAHYDSVEVGKGADDNASGVAVILEVARRIREQNTPYTIRFILFGAEELGLQGSKYYVGHMTEDQIQNTVAMINLDSVTAGDLAYVYGDRGERGMIRDWALEFAQVHHLALQTQPGENPKYPAGTTGDWSDHAPFMNAGIPYTYFEATDWALGDKDGYSQVSTEYGENGKIWHTKYDTLEYLNATFPGRLQERLNLFVTVLEAILTELEAVK
ncbi:MAG: M20/M25/M40 family metallo-hydrolase [Anaerolineales bacterium]|nr:M20/M25/M40 family metallo-hydrolase [Anaerolineales bacterium]